MNFLASLSAGATILFFSGQFEVNLSCNVKHGYLHFPMHLEGRIVISTYLHKVPKKAGSRRIIDCRHCRHCRHTGTALFLFLGHASSLNWSERMTSSQHGKTKVNVKVGPNGNLLHPVSLFFLNYIITESILIYAYVCIMHL